MEKGKYKCSPQKHKIAHTHKMDGCYCNPRKKEKEKDLKFTLPGLKIDLDTISVLGQSGGAIMAM